MPKRLEAALKRTAAVRGYTGKRRDRYVYGTLAKLKAAQRKERASSSAQTEKGG